MRSKLGEESLSFQKALKKIVVIKLIWDISEFDSSIKRVVSQSHDSSTFLLGKESSEKLARFSFVFI